MLVTRHILVVDDEPDVEALISQKFRREIRSGQYAFSFTKNGAEALQKIIEAEKNASTIAKIDMVLTDINMPVMDGLTLLKEMDQLANSPKTVVVSAYSDMDNIRTAMNHGAFDFLTKPINFQDLTVTIERTLKAVAEEDTNATQLQQAQQRLMQSEKLSSLGQMLAGVAHEMNNPVNFIAANLEPTREYIEDLMRLLDLYQQHTATPVDEIVRYTQEIDLDFLRSDLPRMLDSIERGTELISELSQSLKNFSRVDVAEKQFVDIHQGIQSALVILHSRLKANDTRPNIELENVFGSIPPLLCHPNQLNQVIMNLIANAIDAFEESNQGKRYEEIEANPNKIRIETSVVKEKWVRIAIADNGPGISSETIERLFEPFYTTKPADKGTGLGLAISYQIVTENHGGQLTCESSPGQGTQFTIDLPIQ
ncbi:MAG: ATP-binding protein [Cyanobacteria bacterium J06581_3]